VLVVTKEAQNKAKKRVDLHVFKSCVSFLSTLGSFTASGTDGLGHFFIKRRSMDLKILPITSKEL